MKAAPKEKLWFLVLRAVLVIAVVLSLLTVLKKTGLVVRQSDVPARMVEETMGVVNQGGT